MRSIRWVQEEGRRRASLCLCLVLAATSVVGPVSAQSLRGSRSSVDLQAAEAVGHDFAYVVEPAQIRQFVIEGALVPVRGTHNYRLKDVSFPFARPAVKLFIERLASQYRRACGEQLVVTSLTRPRSRQPRNASERSVHPTGMALDLRRPSGRCRSWLEATLLSLESQAVIEATAERRPPHYHVAVFPEQYAAYVARLTERATSDPPPALRVYTVRRGDTLWEIARRHGTSPSMLRRANRLSSSRIHPGQTLTVPGVRR